jgi:hypothetical protein
MKFLSRVPDHLKSLEEVLERLQETGLCVTIKKCKFIRPSTNYLGHGIDGFGLHDKVEPALFPWLVLELKSFTYYSTYMEMGERAFTHSKEVL